MTYKNSINNRKQYSLSLINLLIIQTLLGSLVMFYHHFLMLVLNCHLNFLIIILFIIQEAILDHKVNQLKNKLFLEISSIKLKYKMLNNLQDKKNIFLVLSTVFNKSILQNHKPIKPCQLIVQVELIPKSKGSLVK